MAAYYTYRLLEIAQWDKAQQQIDAVAREGFRYRDAIPRGEGSVMLIFEREATPEEGDAWAAARAALNRSKKPGFGASKSQENEQKYPPEEDE
jgi:hypothetical protein